MLIGAALRKQNFRNQTKLILQCMNFRSIGNTTNKKLLLILYITFTCVIQELKVEDHHNEQFPWWNQYLWTWAQHYNILHPYFYIWWHHKLHFFHLFMFHHIFDRRNNVWNSSSPLSNLTSNAASLNCEHRVFYYLHLLTSQSAYYKAPSAGFRSSYMMILSINTTWNMVVWCCRLDVHQLYIVK